MTAIVEDDVIVAPVPAHAPSLPQHAADKPHWWYTNDNGERLFAVVRHEPNGEKAFLPYTLRRRGDGQLQWKSRGHPTPRPLYRLPELTARPDAPVLVVEGEKTADAAQSLLPDFVVTTSSGGSNSAAGSDWSPMAGRVVIIWPDHDDAGTKYTGDVVSLAREARPASVRVVSVPDEWPPKWDLADPLPEGMTSETLRGMIDDATEPASARENENDEIRSLIILTGHDLLTRQFNPREFVLSPILPEQGLAMLYAKRGIGKTWAALSFGYAVACGSSLWFWKVTRPRKVLHVCGEMPGSTLKERFALIAAGAEKEPPAPDYYRILSADIQDRPLPDLATPEGQALIDTHLGDAEFIILDNVSTLMRSAKENEAESWGPVQDWLLQKRREGRSVLLVHHAGKGGAQRGTSRREDILDTVIVLKSPQDFDPTQGATFEVHLEKARGIAGSDAEPFEARLQMCDSVATWSTRRLEDARRSKIAALHEAGTTVREIANQLGMSKSAVDRQIKKMKERAA